MKPAADEPADGTGPSYARCIGFVREAAAGFPDMRKGSNTSHTIPDAVMSAFAVFFLQSPSWLSCQRAMQDEKGRSNALTLFGIGNVPTDNRVRSLLDPSTPERLRGAYRGLLGVPEGCGALERYRVLGGRTLVALDGTDFHSSEKISCPDCLVTRHRDGRTVYHLFRSWEDFEAFVMKAHQLGPHAPAAPPELTSKGLIRRYAKRKSR